MSEQQELIISEIPIEQESVLEVPVPVPVPVPETLIDPSALCAGERATISTIIATNTAAETAVSTVLADFQELIAQEIASEQVFETDLQNLVTAYSAINLQSTLSTLNVTASKIDTSFTKLQEMIMKNNATASNVLSTIQEGAVLSSQIETAQQDIVSKCATYKKIICCFRDF